MSLHPAAPEGLDGLTAAYVHTVRAISDLGHSLRPGDEERPTACPGWTVLDQFAHVVSLEAWVQGEAVPDVDVSGREHVSEGLSTLVEQFLESRRRRSLAELLEELDDLVSDQVRHLGADSTDPDEPRIGPYGPTTLLGLVGNRVFDLWIHEQDIREAIGRPGNLDSPAAAHTVRVLFDALPRIVARTARVPVGDAVILDLTGPVVGRSGVRVEDHDGKPIGTPLFTGEAHGDAADHAGSTTTITMSTQAATRRCAGRVATADTHVVVHGDEEIARRVLDALVIAP